MGCYISKKVIDRIYGLIDELDAEYFIWNEEALINLQRLLGKNSLEEIKKISKSQIKELKRSVVDEVIDALMYQIDKMNKIEAQRWQYEAREVTERQKAYIKAILGLLKQEDIESSITDIEYSVLIKVLKGIEISDEELQTRKKFDGYSCYSRLKNRDLQKIKQYEVQYIINILRDTFNRKQALLR